jgi:hypothetical protein
MASASISESVMHSITPAKCDDEYYPGEGNTELQCFPTLVDNRFYASLPSLSQGSTNTIIFNPDEGLSDIVLTLQLPAPGGAVTYAGWAFPQNWGASMVTQVALRIGGSALYYFTGDQIFIDTLTDCESSDKKQAVADYSGGLVQGAGLGDLSKRTASVYLKMPFNTISALQKQLPLPTDLLTQPVQILVTFNSFQNVAFWYGAGAKNLATLPVAFSSAQVNFRKTTMQSSEHLLARRENMLTHALSYPLRYFAQTTFRTNIVPGAQQADGSYPPSQINLTGFRSGSVKYIDVWCQKLVNGNPVPGANYNFADIVSARLLINGLVMYDSQFNSGIWSLCERKTTTQFNTVDLVAAADNSAAVPSAAYSSWLTIPFAQVCEDVAFKNVVNLGYPIQNSVVNLQLVLAEGNGADTYQVSAAYHYASSLIFTKNSCEYVF